MKIVLALAWKDTPGLDSTLLAMALMLMGALKLHS